MKIEDAKIIEIEAAIYDAEAMRDHDHIKQPYADLIIAALEKQIPKEPIKEYGVWPDGRERVKILCPECGEDVSDDCTYCDECGQRLK